MHKGTVLNLRQFNSLLVYFKNNWCLLCLTVMFLSGLAFGTYSASSSSFLSKICEQLSSSYLNTRLSKDFLGILIDSLLVTGIFTVLIFIFGTSVTGVTVVPLLIAVRGALFGSLVGSIYSEYSFKGIAFNALILIPPTVISVIFLIIASKLAVRLSLKIIGITLPENSPRNLSADFKGYCKCFLILIVPLIISALIDGWVSIKFVSVFDL